MSNAEQPIAATDLLGDLDLKLPAGFELIAADPKLGPQILSSLARIEERLAEAIATTLRTSHPVTCSPRAASACAPCWLCSARL